MPDLQDHFNQPSNLNMEEWRWEMFLSVCSLRTCKLQSLAIKAAVPRAGDPSIPAPIRETSIGGASLCTASL